MKILKSQPEDRILNTRELELQMTSKLSDINEFENIVLKIVNGSKIRLSDVARLTIGAETDRGFLRANGKNAIGLGIVRQTKSNVLKVTDAVKSEIEKKLDHLCRVI